MHLVSEILYCYASANVVPPEALCFRSVYPSVRAWTLSANISRMTEAVNSVNNYDLFSLNKKKSVNFGLLTTTVS